MKRKNIYKTVLAFLLLALFVIVHPAWPQNTDGQPRPIELGTSGGNINDISILYCCGGTLGALVQATNIQYILSNNHVLARTNKGVIGEDIIQPGLIDQNPVCYKDYNDVVADLSKFVPISFKRGTTNKVDAAIAEVRSGAVDPSGSILHIGEVSSSTVQPVLNMPVQKSGRTTGLTYGTVTAVNVIVDVTYNKTCGIGSQKARFIGQIMIGPAGFSASGDSGSLIVEDCSPYPRAVGLLFAGSNTVTVANPIDYVLTSLGVSMVGGTGYCTSTTISGEITGSSTMTAQSQLPPQANHRAVEVASRIKERHEKSILSIEGVVGMGIGLSEIVHGQVVIEVYVKKPAHEMRRVIPEMLEGVPVKIVETGEIVAY
ncbi:MAG: hypothetical protein Q8N09_08155 [Thermodesulfovibrionia bacterium]|nr:hypothetical protein [Thermodesulfovibrionia bacterium]